MRLRGKRRVLFLGRGNPGNIPVYTATLRARITAAKRDGLDAAHQATRGKGCLPFRVYRYHGGVLWEERTQDSWPSFLN